MGITETEKILKAAEAQYLMVGYVDIILCVKMSGIPSIIVENVLGQNNYKKSFCDGQWIRITGGK